MSDLVAGSMVAISDPAFFHPEFSSVYSAYLIAALSKGQGSFFILPMKATYRQKDLLHHSDITDSCEIPYVGAGNWTQVFCESSKYS